MPKPVDLYAVLQVHPSAHPRVIHNAYTTLKQIYHTEPRPMLGAAAQMSEIDHAYAVIGDADRRADYDRQRDSVRARISEAICRLLDCRC